MSDTDGQTQPRRVMGIFAHPDDPEFFCGATFARWAADGADITFVMATSGDKGSADPEMTSERLAAIREQEECNAAAVLGVKDVIFLRYPDGELQPTLQLRRDLVRLIRMKQPDTVVTCDPTVFYWPLGGINHPDHRAIGEAVLDAVYPTARDRLNFIELERDEGLPTHKVRYVYLSGTLDPNLRMDVTGHVETKIMALREHKSQIADMEAMAERIRNRLLDTKAPPEYPSYIESFRLITLA
ncbi:MAG: PIG-L deacetylase family protein [bacterium]|nr:PIG-L deacetylase family protein [bacterium]